MATLTGNKIKDTYSGILKTENNGAISGQVDVTDGAGNNAGFALNPGNGEITVKGTATAIPRLSLKDTKVGNLSAFVAFDALDGNNTRRAQINFDEYSSFNLVAAQIGQFNDPELVVQNTAKTNAPAKIAVQLTSHTTAYASANNSDNWFTAYNERITAGSYDGGTSNLTLTKPDGTDIVVNIPAGGGSAGVENGSFGVDSLITNSALTTNPAEATQADTIAFGNGAQAYSSGVIAIGTSAGSTGTTHWGSISIGNNTSINGFGCVALGPGAVTNGNSAISIGDSADALSGNGIAIGTNAYTNSSDSIAIGVGCDALSGPSIAIGRNAYASGSVATAIGNSANVQSQHSILISGEVGSISSAGQRSVAIGRQVVVNNPYSLAIGNYARTYGTASMSFSSCQINTNSQNASNALMMVPGQYGCTTNANASDSIVLGSATSQLERATTNATAGIAIGKNAVVDAANAVALGAGVTATVADATSVTNLVVQNYASLNFADDTAAAAGGVSLGQIYHNAGALRIRIV